MWMSKYAGQHPRRSNLTNGAELGILLLQIPGG